ncbi:hypothetical protein ACFYZ5_44090 [Streptomyces chartreusis]|uniref:hypothetical protein n=1 Tax=Streptomyces chartreusis TaxID=1969 RepID=UPI0036BA841E
MEPVLGTMVPVERDTLIRRWYVHRIRLDSEGTARRVRIGTEAFARPTEWFGLDECAMTERGLTTPAVERIVKARTTAPPASWPAAKNRKGPDVEARAQVLLRQLASARHVESVVVVNRACREIAGLTGASSATQTELDDAVHDAHQWLQGQADVRRELFARLEEAVTTRNAHHSRELLTRANATAAHDRTEIEDRIAGTAADFVAEQARAQAAADAEKAAERADKEMTDLAVRAAFETVRRVLRELRHRPRRHISKATLHSQVQLLVEAAATAGTRVTASQRLEIDRWVKRAERAQSAAPEPAVPASSQGKDPASTPRVDTSTGTAEQPNTITVWVWKDRYGGLHAADTPTRPEASVRHVPLPTDAGPLRRLYGNLTRMIAEREAARAPVHTNRAAMSVRIWEEPSGELSATLARRKGCTAVTLPLPAELEQLRGLRNKVVAQMAAHRVTQKPWPQEWLSDRQSVQSVVRRRPAGPGPLAVSAHGPRRERCRGASTGRPDWARPVAVRLVAPAQRSPRTCPDLLESLMGRPLPKPELPVCAPVVPGERSGLSRSAGRAATDLCGVMSLGDDDV